MEKVSAWKTTDGQTFGSLAEAQKHEINELLHGATEEVVDAIMTNAEALANVLTLKDGSHPKARAASGATRKRKGQAAAVAPKPEAE